MTPYQRLKSSVAKDCFDFHEHPGWRNDPDKFMGVTWDAWCSRCGFRIEGARFDGGKGVGITANGRRLAPCTSQIIQNNEVWTSNMQRIYCSRCVPSVLG